MTGRSACFFAALAALLAGALLSLRAEAHAQAFALLAGAAALLALPWLLLFGAERKLPLPLVAFFVAGGLAALPLERLAVVLKVGTHHRPLGAVTYGVLALLVLLALFAACVRLLTWASGSRARRGFARAAYALAGLGPLALVVRLFSGGETQRGALDISLALGAALGFAFLPWPNALRRAAPVLGPWLWGLVVALGFAALGVGALTPAEQASPAVSAALGWFAR